MSVPTHLQEAIEKIPHSPGVYKYLDRQHRIIYIGKAKDLRKRVLSYFLNEDRQNGKTRLLVRQIQQIDIILVNNEEEALLLENSLIKENKPKYNILLKDDKTYPWVMITHEEYPRIVITRRLNRSEGLYFGPFVSKNSIVKMLDGVREVFPYRTCKLQLTQERIQNGQYSTCLEYHIHRCKAPCIGEESLEDYNEAIQSIKSLLKGKTSDVIELLREKMDAYAESLEFEEAEQTKRQIELLRNYQHKSYVANPNLGDFDSIVVVTGLGKIAVNYMQIRHGSIILSINQEIRNPLEQTEESIVEYASTSLKSQYRSESQVLITNVKIEEKIASYKRVETPAIGDKYRLIEIGLMNAKKHLHQLSAPRRKAPEKLLEMVKERLELKFLPQRIECIDNSNTLGTYPVSAVVCFMNGVPAKEQYRIYNVKGVQGPNDYATMHETLTRRYSKQSENELPNLLIMDGGKGQLKIGIEVLRDLGLTDKMDICALAEVHEEIYRPGYSKPLVLDRNDPILQLFIQLRDEAHRFGVKHHTKKRDTALTRSTLLKIEGVGEATIAKLYSKLKSIQNIKKASLEELAEIIGMYKANRVYRAIRLAEENKKGKT